MVERVSRTSRRTEFLIGFSVVLAGVVVIVIGQAVDSGWVSKAGMVVVALGALAAVGTILSKRNDGTRIWQTDQGTSSGAGGG